MFYVWMILFFTQKFYLLVMVIKHKKVSGKILQVHIYVYHFKMSSLLRAVAV